MKHVVVMFALALASASAFADPALDAKAKAHGERAQKLYRDGSYAEARAEFSAAFDLSGRTGFIFNMAECSRLLGDTVAARMHYAKYLALDPNGKLAPLAKRRLEALAGPTPTGPPPPPPPTTAVAPRPSPPTTAAPSPVAPPPTAVQLAPEQPVVTGVVGLEHRSEPRSMWTRWPVWAAIGAGVVATSAVIFVATRSDDCGAHCVDWR